jgi:hypothetical protein
MSPEPPASFALHLSAETGAELFVIDSSMRLVERGAGRLDVQLPTGVYKLKVRRGREETERIILHDHDESITLAAPSISSPAPFQGTTRTHEWHIDAAVQQSSQVHVVAGTGAQVFVMSRYWTAPGRKPDDRGHPARGLSLRTLAGRVVVDYDATELPHVDGHDAWAACTVAVDPGTYLLHRETDGGQALEQAVVASPTWQTQVFILRDPVTGLPRPEGPHPSIAQQRALRPDAISVLMNHGHFDAQRSDMQLADVARLALADERRILSDELRQMLDGKFDNPMLGIYGAHLLVLSLDRAAREAREKPDQAQLALDFGPGDLDVIVRNLRNLVGPGHPDVEALSTRCLDASLRADKPLSAPPMLRRSWSLYVAASNEQADLIPRDVWTRVRQFVSAPPYFTWVRTASTGTDPAVAVVRSVQKRQARTTEQLVRTAGSPAARAVPAGAAAGVEQAVGALAAPRLAPEPDPRQLSLDHDIPRGVIDEAFRGR